MTSQHLDSSPWPSISSLGVSKLDENREGYDEDQPASRNPGPGFLDRPPSLLFTRKRRV